MKWWLPFILNGGRILSLVLSVGMIALWVRSYWISEGVRYARGVWDDQDGWGREANTTAFRGVGFGAYTDPGRLHLFARSGTWLHSMGCAYWNNGHFIYGHVKPKAQLFAGVMINHDIGQRNDSWELRMPMAYVIALLVVAPALWAIGLCLRRRRTRSPNSCRSCGYDLRATPQCCPECGAVAIPSKGMTEMSS
jgi:hypothetical protein